MLGVCVTLLTIWQLDPTRDFNQMLATLATHDIGSASVVAALTLPTPTIPLPTVAAPAAQPVPPVVPAKEVVVSTVSPVFPQNIEKILSGDSLLSQVPRDKQHIVTKVNASGATTVYVMVPKNLIPKGVTAWSFYERFGNNIDRTQHSSTAHLNNYTAYLALVHQLNRSGVARNVAAHGWHAFQHGTTLVPILVQHKTQVADIIQWKHATESIV